MTELYRLATTDEIDAMSHNQFVAAFPGAVVRDAQAERDRDLAQAVRARLSTHDADSIRWLAQEFLKEKRLWMSLMMDAIADALSAEATPRECAHAQQEGDDE